MLSLAFSLYLSVTLAMCFIRIRVGIAMFIAYSILVPYLQIFSFGQNFFYALIFISLLLKYNFSSFIFKPIKPFLFLFLTYLLTIPFHYEVPYSFQLNFLRSDFMSAILLPFVMVNVMKNDDKAFELFYRAIMFSIFVASVYSIYLTTMPGINPYLIATLPLSGREFNEAYALAEDGGRIFGRISGVFAHPMTNGLFLSLSLIFVLYQVSTESVIKNKLSFTLHIIILLCVFASLIVIGIRTAIVAASIGIFIYMLLEKNIKSVIIGALAVGVVLVITQSIPELSTYLGSIVEKDSSNVHGSSIEMRLDQLNAAINSISNNYIFGNGYGWTTFYQVTRGGHPTMLHFESLLIMVLTNNGFLGVIFWISMLFMYYFGARRNLLHKPFNFILTLMSVYIVYSMVTGEYNYLKYFLIFYSLMWIQGKKSYQFSHKLPR
jgi:hypothetical protein